MNSLKELLKFESKPLNTRVAACPEDKEVLNSILEAYELGICSLVFWRS